jgi:biofilm PGA synthesis lipoprotein PgaB
MPQPTPHPTPRPLALLGVLPALLCLFLFPRPAAASDAAPPESAGPPPSRAVVLMYHRFGEAAYPSTNVRLDQFEAQLAHLAAGGYRVWPLARVVEHLERGRPAPDRVVAITVDDAYRSVYTEAYPRLKARGWPFTVFVATDAVDSGSSSLLTWDQMREMQGHGATFANHSASHDHLVARRPGEDAAAWVARVGADIRRAERRLTEELGTSPPFFAYPYGEYNLDLAGLVRRLGYTPFGQQSGAVGPAVDSAAWPRYPVSEAYGDLDGFRLKVDSLPLPVTRVVPRDPVVGRKNPPRMEVTVTPGDPRLDALACFAQGQGRVPLTWLERDAGRFAVAAPRPLPVGRGRYNCTAPSRALAGRYYWFSHLWLRPEP